MVPLNFDPRPTFIVSDLLDGHWMLPVASSCRRGLASVLRKSILNRYIITITTNSSLRPLRVAHGGRGSRGDDIAVKHVGTTLGAGRTSPGTTRVGQRARPSETISGSIDMGRGLTDSVAGGHRCRV